MAESNTLAAKQEFLEGLLAASDRVLVAYSGGVDSAYLAWAAHQVLGDNMLAVIADSTAWATQVRLLAPMLVRRLNEEVGDGSVRRVKVRGPQPPRQRGGWRVPGSKGPGDTYG